MTERRTQNEPVPKLGVLAENKAVWEQFFKELKLGAGTLG
jgi:hypothetical protein